MNNLRRLWIAPILAGVVGVLALAGWAWIQTRKNSEPELQGPSSTTPSAVSGKTSPLRFRPPPGQALHYDFKGSLDARCLFRSGENSTPLRLRLEGVEASFTLDILDQEGSSALIALVPVRFTGRACAGDASSPSIQSLEIQDIATKSAKWDKSAIFRLSPTGELLQVYVDPQFRSRSWIEGGYSAYLKTTLTLLSFFPPLPSEASESRPYEGAVTLFDLVGADFAFTRRTDSSLDPAFDGYPKRLTRFFGFPLKNSADFPAVGADSVAKSSMVYSEAIGYFKAVRHHVDLASEEDFAKIEASLEYTGSTPLSGPTFDFRSLESMEGFASVADLRDLLAQLDQTVSKNKESPRPPAGEVARLMDLLDQCLAEDTEHGTSSADENQERLAELIASNPELLAELETTLRAHKYADPTLLAAAQILSRQAVSKLPGADRIAVFVVGSITNDDEQFNALLSLQSFKKSDLVLDYLMSAVSENRQVEDSRSSSLASVLKLAIQENDTARTERIVDYMTPGLEKGGQSQMALLAAFRTPSVALDALVEKKWSSGLNPHASLKLLLVRSDGELGKADQFRKIVQANVFTTFADDQIIAELIPLAVAAENTEFLEFLKDKAPTAEVRDKATGWLNNPRLHPR